LSSKVLDLTVREGHEVVALQKVEHALAEKVHNDAYMSAVVEAVPEMYAPVPVLLIVGLQRAQDPKLDLAGIAVFLDRADDLDGNAFVAASAIDGLDDFAKRALSQELVHLIYAYVSDCGVRECGNMVEVGCTYIYQ